MSTSPISSCSTNWTGESCSGCAAAAAVLIAWLTFVGLQAEAGCRDGTSIAAGDGCEAAGASTAGFFFTSDLAGADLSSVVAVADRDAVGATALAACSSTKRRGKSACEVSLLT